MGVKFEVDRFKVQLKMAIARLQTTLQKHQNSATGRRKEIAELLRNGSEERARVLVKYLIRDDYMMEAYEMVQLMCDDILRSAVLISQESKMDSSLAPTIKSLIFAAPRMDIPELHRVQEQFYAKYGASTFQSIHPAEVDQRLAMKLSVKSASDPFLIDRYLVAIAEGYDVDWAPTSTLLGHEEPIYPNAPSKPTAIPTFPPPYSPTSSSNEVPVENADNPPSPTYDDLTRRFQALKQNKKN